MRPATMLIDVTRSLFRKPATERYPFVRYEPPERLRGRLSWDPQDCIGCELCIKDCPSQALEMIVLDKQAKRYVVRYYLDRCSFCAQCVQSCRQACLSMAHQEWELAGLHRSDFIYLLGNPEDIQNVLDKDVRTGLDTIE